MEEISRGKTNAGVGGRGLAKRLWAASRRVCREVARCARLAERAESLPSGAEWLMDNRYLAERMAKGAAAALRRGGRMLRGDSGKALLEEWCASLLSDTLPLSVERLGAALSTGMEGVAMREKELFLFPAVLTLILIEKLSLAANTLRRTLEERQCGTDAETEQASRDAEYVFACLRFLAEHDLGPVLEKASPLDKLFSGDPAGVYPQMDRESRSLYRHTLSRLAKKAGLSEVAAAGMVLSLAGEKGKHIGEYLFHRPLGRAPRPKAGAYSAAILLAVLLADLFLLCFSGSPAAAAAGLLPLYGAVRAASDFLLLKLLRPQRLPRLRMEGGIPAGAETVCALTVLLTSKESTKRAIRALEEYRIANRDAGERLSFVLLADLPEAAEEATAADEELLRTAREGIEGLNRRYGGGFALFLRPRRHAPRDGSWRGWERKRGAILELCAWLSGMRDAGLAAHWAAGKAPKQAKYLIVLDADTRLTVGSALELVSVMEHPLVSPVVDRERRVVLRGHGILQPRVALDLAAAERSDFARLFGGQGGVDPYSSVCCDLYQDLFDRGSFSGKGILSVEAVSLCLQNRFPEDRILSHDLLEGEYLRCGFAGDVELTDGFPAHAGAYYKRLHRWVRGDWQTLPWLFPRVPGREGREKNPLDLLSRWKIFDNLCRSLIQPACLLCLFLWAFSVGGSRWAALAAFLSLGAELLTAFADLFRRPKDWFHRRYAARAAYGFSAMLLRFSLKLLFLPLEAFTALSACLTALYRMLISHRGLLQWITAEEAEGKRKDGVPAAYRQQWFSVLTGTFFLFFAFRPLPAALGLLWLFAPAASAMLSREKPPQRPLRQEDAAYLRDRAAEIWRFFDELMAPERGFLPPDNLQEEPVRKLAERASPTNMGLALLAPLAALDLGLCRRERAVSLIVAALDTVEKLPRWKGLLYNWYELKSKAVLRPAYVSSVDCGNFAACMAALETGLNELGERELAARAGKLLRETDLRPLYDPERRLFRIGILTEEDKPGDGCYDLMVSEARLTSYLALAMGWADKKHWRSLSRVLRRRGGHSGMASWTGSVFEYFMPSLLLDNFRCSLMDDSLRLCVAEQRRAGRLWGTSESAFDSFDAAMNYRYEAHGVQGLALKRGMDRERVVSPYSSFLALPKAAGPAVRNLQRLEAMGMLGRYGFYEALDLTPERCGDQPGVVRCFMAHHLGMSLLALDNALCAGRMRGRLMGRPEFAAYRELLQEKGPVGERISREKPLYPEKDQAMRTKGRWQRVSQGREGPYPACSLLSNGSYNLLMTEDGTSRSFSHGMELTRFDMEEGGGPLFFVRVGERLIPLQPAPAFEKDVRYTCVSEADRFRLYASAEGLESSLEVTVSRTARGERRELRLTNHRGEAAELEVLCYFEPVLAPRTDYEAHPAFSKLCVESLRTGDCVVFRRRTSTPEEVGLCLAFASSEPSVCDTFRQEALGRGGLRALGLAAARPGEERLGPMLDPCLLARVKLRLAQGERTELRFSLACGDGAEAAAEQALAILKAAYRPSDQMEKSARRLKMDADELEGSMELLSAAVFGWSGAEDAFIRDHSEGRGGLWRFGISGDRPVIALRAAGGERAVLRSVISRQALLRLGGFETDLVFLTGDKGEYLRPEQNAIRTMAVSLGCGTAVDAPGGIHVIAADGRESEAMLAAADVIFPLREKPEKREKRREIYFYPRVAENRLRLTGEYDEQGTFVFDTKGGLSDTAWTHPLTNGSFGTLAADCGCGFLWAGNAREKRLTPWVNDPLLDRWREELTLVSEGESVSLFAACDGWNCRVRFGFGFAQWEKEKGGRWLRTTAFIPPDRDCRVLLVEQRGFGERASLCQRLRLVLGDDNTAAKTVLVSVKGNTITARSTEISSFPRQFVQLCGASLESWEKLPQKHPAWRFSYACGSETVLLTGCDEVVKLNDLTFPRNARTALNEAREGWREICDRFRLKSPSPRLDAYLNCWAMYQTVACRLMARTSLYQSGGAFGFRDQLQDVCAALPFLPELAERQILAAAAHQYEEGDVQHWWHPDPSGDRGVRTRCSDDLLWLPYSVCRYLSVTGDSSLLEKEAPFLHSPPLAAEEQDRYEPSLPAASATVYQHCLRAIDCFLSRPRGSGGLPLMGSGDWNDGFNRVRGESVWLGWFSAMVLRDFAAFCPGEKADRLFDEAKALAQAAENAWEGGWYLRGTMADGTPFGKAGDRACAIDSIAQSFAVLSGWGGARAREAVLRAYELLYDPKSRTVKLFDPPFDGPESDPGYIRRYLPGVRENGGQYTHAAVWLAMALLRCGEADKGWELLEALLPGERDAKVYKTEPYVLAADVYTAQGHLGRGGWSWYTGAAGWFLRAVTEELLGLRYERGVLTVKPRLPSAWDGYKARINGQPVIADRDGVTLPLEEQSRKNS